MHDTTTYQILYIEHPKNKTKQQLQLQKSNYNFTAEEARLQTTLAMDTLNTPRSLFWTIIGQSKLVVGVAVP